MITDCSYFSRVMTYTIVIRGVTKENYYGVLIDLRIITNLLQIYGVLIDSRIIINLLPIQDIIINECISGIYFLPICKMKK